MQQVVLREYSELLNLKPIYIYLNLNLLKQWSLYGFFSTVQHTNKNLVVASLSC